MQLDTKLPGVDLALLEAALAPAAAARRQLLAKMSAAAVEYEGSLPADQAPQHGGLEIMKELVPRLIGPQVRLGDNNVLLVEPNSVRMAAVLPWHTNNRVLLVQVYTKPWSYVALHPCGYNTQKVTPRPNWACFEVPDSYMGSYTAPFLTEA